MKWKPSKAQRREFAQKMQDPNELAAYLKRKEDRAAKRRAGSRYDYDSAGGEYVATKEQHDFALYRQPDNLTQEQIESCNMVIMSYGANEKTHHDHIHRVNELIRAEAIKKAAQ